MTGIDNKKMTILERIRKDPLLLSALPVIGSFIAFAFDMGILDYFDIPTEYAEINFYSIYSGTVVSIIVFCGFWMLFALGAVFSSNKNIYYRAASSAAPLSILAISLYLMFLADLPIWYAFACYLFFIAYIYLQALLAKDKSSTFSEKLENIIEQSEQPSISPRAKLKTADRFLLIAVVPFIVFIALTGTIMRIAYIAAEGMELSFIKGDNNTIVFKRNNDLYILKRFDPDTHILEHEFTLRKLDSNQIVLVKAKLNHPLVTSEKAKLKEEQRATREAQTKTISNFFKSIF
ncbi:MAG TPA: hypothetical protein VGJ90_04125 [Methylophilaceae bacterium]|jgi:hypothetical protein